jgi:metal-dependent amidase/aminoacylase/carboxypeptidase family protein
MISRKAALPDWAVSAKQHCAEINEAAQNRMELIVPELAKQYGVTEQLKAENQMEWVRQMNACKAQAEETVKAELIYD